MSDICTELYNNVHEIYTQTSRKNITNIIHN